MVSLAMRMILADRLVKRLSSIIGRFRSGYCDSNWQVFGPSIVSKLKRFCRFLKIFIIAIIIIVIVIIHATCVQMQFTLS